MRDDADAADDEQALLLDADAPHPPPRRPGPRPARPRRAAALTTLLLLTLPFLSLLYLSALVNPTPHPEHPSPPTASLVQENADTFALDPKFDLAEPPRTRVYRWTVSTLPVARGGETWSRVVVNGRSPGPIIQANVHDRILVYVTNNLTDEGTSIHWHGLPQPDTPFYDGAPGISQCPIPPGQTLLYNFTFGGWSGTTWWHGHTGMQHTDGLFGPLVVHAPDERGLFSSTPSLPSSSAASSSSTSPGSVSASGDTPSADERDSDPADRQSDANNYAYDSEHVLTLTDVYYGSAAGMLPAYLTSNPHETTPEPVPDAAAINGRGGGGDAGTDGDGGYVEVRVRRGRSTLLRLIHAGTFAPLRVSVDRHALTVLTADGTPVVPVKVRDVVLRAAQRVGVLVTAGEDGEEEEFWIRVRMEEGVFAYSNPRMQPEARAVLRYTASSSSKSNSDSDLNPLPLPTTTPGPPPHAADADVAWDALPQFDEWNLRPLLPRAPPTSDFDTPTLSLPFKFSIQRTHQQNWRSFVNDTSWEVPPEGEAALVADVAGVFRSAGEGVEEGSRRWPGDQLIATFAHGRTVDVVITNLDDGEHPFHLHGYTPWLLGKGRGRYKPITAKLELSNPMRRDTFTVPARGWAVVRIVTENAGYWAFHCHIAWHMAGGGLFQLAVAPAPGEAAVMALPQDIVEQCKMWA
ncbi:multi-copper oxidase [Mycena galericulata]|nr:multi-copper oxidase [Mycena galericulata]